MPPVVSCYRIHPGKVATAQMTKSNPLVEVKNPEAAAAAIDAATDPFTSVRKAAKMAGLPKTTTQRLIARLKTQYKPLDDELVSLKTVDLLALLDDRIARTLQHLNDDKIAEASAYHQALIFGILVDKAQLLKGQATVIVGHEKRKEMDELFVLLVQEGKRRGFTIDGDYEVVTDPPATPTALPRPPNGNTA